MKKGYLSAFFGAVLTVILLASSDGFSHGISAGLKNCVSVIIPSLFPFMVAASLFGMGKFPNRLNRFTEPFSRFLFRLPADGMYALLIGLFGGYPAGAKAIYSLHGSGKLSKSQAERLLLFCINPGAGFCVNAVGSGLLSSRKAGMIMLASLCLGAVILGFLSGGIYETAPCSAATAKKDFPQAFVESVSSGANGMLAICAYVAFFSGVIGLVSSVCGENSFLADLCVLLEITGGCAQIAPHTSLPVITALCGFGGFCVHFQVFSIAGQIKPSYLKFYLFRILHAIVSGGICAVLLRLFPVEIQTASLLESARLSSFSLPASVSLLILSFMLILELDTERKIC